MGYDYETDRIYLRTEIRSPGRLDNSNWSSDDPRARVVWIYSTRRHRPLGNNSSRHQKVRRNNVFTLHLI